MKVAALRSMDAPREVQIEPVGECALPVRSLALMSFDGFCALLAQFPALERLSLQGRGDPLAHPRFCDMVAAAVARGIEVSARSPLHSLSERRAEALAKCGLRYLEVIVDAADPDRSLRHAERLRKTKLRLGLLLPEVRVVADEGSKGRCDRPWRRAYINYYGRAMPCDKVNPRSRLGFGNMRREGVAKVWSNDAYRGFREALASDHPPEVCAGCAFYRGAA